MKRLFLTIIAVLMGVLSIQAESISIGNVVMEKGTTTSATISLANSNTNLVSFQMDIHLPDGITVNKAGCSLSTRFDANEYELTIGKQSDGVYRLTSTSFSLTPISGTSGAIITLSLTASQTPMESTASIKNIRFVTSGSTRINIADASFNITVKDNQEQTLNLTSIPSQTYGSTYTLPSQTDQELALTWTVTNNSVATVSDNVLTASGVGSTTVTATQAGNYLYSSFTKDYTLTVTKAPLTVTAKSYTIKQGEALPTFEAAYSGFKNSDTESAISTQPSFSCSAQVGSAPGTYDIIASGADATNYSFTYVNGTLTVTAADPVTITANSYSITYGEAIPDLGYTSTGAAVSGTPSVSCTATSSSSVGTYPITITQGSVTNYNASYVNGTLTISPKTVSSPTITLSQTSYTYDGNAKEPTVTVKDGDTTIPASEYTVSYTDNTNVGTATVTVTDQDGGNYTISGSTTFSIASADGSLTPPTGKSGLVYTGAAQDLITAGSSTTGTIQYSLDGTNYATTIPQGTDAKEYTVYYKVVANAGYNDVDPSSFKVTISPKTVSSPTITLSQTSYTYDGNAKEPTVTVKDGDATIPASEYTVSYKDNTEAGTATVTVTDQDGGNYTVSGSVTFTITAPETPSIVNNDEPITVDGQELYEPSEEVAEAIEETIEADIALPAEADGRVEVTDDGSLKFSKGEDLLVALLDMKLKDIVKFVFTGRLFGDSSKLRLKNAASRGTRAAGDMELFSEVEYEVIEAGDQTVTIKLTEAEATVEAISVSKPEEAVTIKVNTSGKNTYTTAEALDFSEVDGLKAYVATGYESNGTIWLTRVKQVPAGTPILIKGEAGKTYEVPVMEKCVAHFENMFMGSADEDLNINVTSADGKWNNFYMASGSFKKVTGPRTIGKGKCYLQLPASFKAANAGADQTVKIADSGKSSYAPPVDIDLTNVEGLKAYAATGYDAANRTIWLTRINKIQAGEGILLKGEKGKTYTLPSADVQAYYGNMFVGNIGDKITIGETSDDGEWTNFYLASGSFKKVSGTREIGTNKSYLHLPTSLLVSSARGKQNAGTDEWFMEELETETMLLGSIGGDDDGTTRIDAIREENSHPDVYYNLQGQRVNSPKKGLYIKNGKKVIVK